MFNHEQLLKLSKWEPLEQDFGREDHRCYEAIVRPLRQSLMSQESVRALYLDFGNLAIFATVFIYEGKGDVGSVAGLLVYLSLLTPVAAMGRSNVHIAENECGWSSLEPSQILSADELTAPHEQFAVAWITSVGLRLLGREEALEKLPDDVRPFEYCLNAEPWDRVFHVLFAETD